MVTGAGQQGVSWNIKKKKKSREGTKRVVIMFFKLKQERKTVCKSYTHKKVNE